jgi:hypothetical protein
MDGILVSLKLGWNTFRLDERENEAKGYRRIQKRTGRPVRQPAFAFIQDIHGQGPVLLIPSTISIFHKALLAPVFVAGNDQCINTSR